MEEKKYILLTGASSGLGKYMALRLSREYNLVLNGRDSGKLDAIRSECTDKDQHLLWEFDLNNVADLEASYKAFAEAQGVRISGFIHCAGYLKMLPLKSISSAHLAETMNVNFNAAVLLIKLLLNRKLNSDALRNIVFISSTASIMGAKAFNVYSASKGALDALMRSLAVELAPRVRVNSVLPGGIQTQMTDHMFNDPELLQRMAKDYPLGLGQPEDIYEMVDFLLSGRSKWITGQQLVVDGGRSINITA